MPLPFIIGAIAAAAAAGGLGAGIHGGIKMKEASDTAKAAQRRNDENVARLKSSNEQTMKVMDRLGEHEMQALASFDRFSTVWGKIKNPPSFAQINKGNITLSTFTPQDVKDASVGASILLGGLGGATLGTAGGFAAAGGTTAAVMALGTASTGTAISTLSGVAATNATLAALGGGALAAGGGGMALGSLVLGGATLGVGLLIGGIIFSVAGSSVSNKADEAWNQMKKNEQKINSIRNYLQRLKSVADEFDDSLLKVNGEYLKFLPQLEYIVLEEQDYNKFTDLQKRVTENTVLLVGLLYDMCKVQLVEKAKNENELNKINEDLAKQQIAHADEVLSKINAA